MNTPFNLSDWTARWNDVCADLETTVLLDPGSELRRAAEARGHNARLELLAELATALAGTEQRDADYMERPYLWAIQEAARVAVRRSWIISAA